MNVGFTYEIRDKTNTDLVYYGSSEMPSLEDRMKDHLSSFKLWKKNNNNGYCSSYKVLELNNYKETLLKIVFFTIKWELREQERHLIEYRVCVNEQIPNRTMAEWRQANSEHIKEYQSEHYQANKEQKAEWYQDNKEKVKEKNKEYKAENKEKIKEQKKEYRAENKDKIKERYQENKETLSKKFNCPCGGKYTHANKSTHNKSKLHQNWLKTQE